MNPTTRTVSVRDEANRTETLGYDKLILGTGAVSVAPPIEGIDSPGVFFLRWMDDTFAVERHLGEHKLPSAIIVGGGYIGMETAEGSTRLGIAVTVIGCAAAVMTTLDPDIGQRVAERLAGNGVQVTNHVAVQAIEREAGRLAVSGSGGLRRNSDMVLVMFGARPMTDFAAILRTATSAADYCCWSPAPDIPNRQRPPSNLNRQQPR